MKPIRFDRRIFRVAWTLLCGLLASTFSNLPGCGCLDILDPAPRSITIVASFTDSTGSILRFKPNANLNKRRPLHGFILRDNEWARSRPGTSELVVGFLDESGSLVGEPLGFPGRSEYLVDRTTPEGLLRGGSRRPKADVRVLHLPVPRRTRFVAFYKYRVHARDPRDTGAPQDTISVHVPATGPPKFLSKKLLHVMSLPDRFFRTRLARPRLVAIPAGSGTSATTMSLHEPEGASTDPLYSTAVEDAPTTTGDGDEDEDILLLRSCGPNEDCYNIVVAGDGFDATEMGDYEERATALIDALLETPPMSSHPDGFNVYLVKTPSNDTGISCCGAWAGSERDTYFGTRGQWLIESCDGDAPGAETWA